MSDQTTHQPEYSVDWFSGNIPTWNQVFSAYGLTGKPGMKALEIGCFEGRATNYLLENILTGEGSCVHVVDTFMGSQQESGMNWTDDYKFSELLSKFQRNIEPYKDRVYIHRGISGTVLKRDFEDNTFDFIYIDGSHTAYDVLQDAVLAHPLLKSGGVLIFDDLGWMDPKNPHPTNSPQLGVTSFINTYRLFYDNIFQGYQAGFVKK